MTDSSTRGLVFFGTPQRDRVVAFYRDRLDATEWLEQPAGCTILRVGTLLVGFCDAPTPETEGTITLAVPDCAAVDDRYAALRDVARGPPAQNDAFDIYQFFLDDPDGRPVEIQAFLHDLPTES